MDPGPLPRGAGQGKASQHQAEGFVPGSEDCLSSSSSSSHPACPQLHRLPGYLGLEKPWDVFSSPWPKAGGPHIPHKAVTPLIPTITQCKIGDLPRGKSAGSQHQIEAYLFNPPKNFPVASTPLFAPNPLQFSVLFVQLINESVH